MTHPAFVRQTFVIGGLFVVASLSISQAAEPTGLISKPSSHSVQETVDGFKRAVGSKGANGWMVFTEIDHAAAAKANGLSLKPRTVIVFGNPKLGTSQWREHQRWQLTSL